MKNSVKNIFLLCIIFCFVATNIHGMELQLRNGKFPKRGVVKPKNAAQEHRELKRVSAARIIANVNRALYHLGLAREELEDNGHLDLAIQTSRIEKAGRRTLPTVRNIDFNPETLDEQLEGMQADTVETYCEVAFAASPQETFSFE